MKKLNAIGYFFVLAYFLLGVFALSVEEDAVRPLTCSLLVLVSPHFQKEG